MPEPHLPDLLIEGYRGLRRLELKKLGNVNLIVGRNGVGKTSVLEAVRLYASGVAEQTLNEILETRDEREPPSDSLRRFEQRELRSLFTRTPPSISYHNPIRIGNTSHPLEFSLGSVDGVSDDLGYTVYVYKPEDFDLPAMEFRIDAIRVQRSGKLLRLLPLSRNVRFVSAPNSGLPLTTSSAGDKPCVFVSSAGVGESEFGRHWDSMLLAGNEEETISAIRSIMPNVARIWMLGGDGDARRRVVAKLDGRKEPVPLRSMGDGVFRFLSLSCALVAAKDGFLLIDEFENGLHYTTQESLWKFLIQTARELNVQVFATTHSRDCIAAFGRATAADRNSSGILFRLEEFNGEIVETHFDENSIATITENLIEVR